MHNGVTFQDEQPSIFKQTKIYNYRPARRGWRHISAEKYDTQTDHPSSLQLVSWNLDHSAPYGKQRMHYALRHLETYVFRCTDGQDPVACCIMFQEVNKEALAELLDDHWVRKHFVLTPRDTSDWPREYGNVTLVTRTVAVGNAGILNFSCTNAGRSAVIVDVKVTSPKANAPKEMVLRMVNTQLESTLPGVRMRALQLGVLSTRLREDVLGGVIAGSMCAFAPEDDDLPHRCNLTDAWTFPSKNPSGYTWGFQDSGEFPPARLDKILYVERRKTYTVDSPKRIGMALKAMDVNGMHIGWASDHYGLLARLLVRAR